MSGRVDKKAVYARPPATVKIISRATETIIVDQTDNDVISASVPDRGTAEASGRSVV
jgi:hypothetical protein